MSQKIPPSIGRVIWYYPSGFREGDQPQPALICFVHSDSMVNLAVFNSNGNSYGATSIPLVQDGEPAPENSDYCAWMPYQIGQAKRHETSDSVSTDASKPKDDADGANDAGADTSTDELVSDENGASGASDEVADTA